MCPVLFYSFIPHSPHPFSLQLPPQEGWEKQTAGTAHSPLSCVLAWQNHTFALKTGFRFYECLWQAPSPPLESKVKSAMTFSFGSCQALEVPSAVHPTLSQNTWWGGGRGMIIWRKEERGKLLNKKGEREDPNQVQPDSQETSKFLT